MEAETINQKTYYEEHKEEAKAYREAHKEEIAIRKAKYYIKNKEKLLATSATYAAAHKEESKAYREANKEALYAKANIKLECKCGGQYAKRHKKRHDATNKHKKFLSDRDYFQIRMRDTKELSKGVLALRFTDKICDFNCALKHAMYDVVFKDKENPTEIEMLIRNWESMVKTDVWLKENIHKKIQMETKDRNKCFQVFKKKNGECIKVSESLLKEKGNKFNGLVKMEIDEDVPLHVAVWSIIENEIWITDVANGYHIYMPLDIYLKLYHVKTVEILQNTK